MKKRISAREAKAEHQMATITRPSMHTKPIADEDKEKDADELAHAKADVVPDETIEKDIDDLVHSNKRSVVVRGDEERDIDDLMHKK